MAENHVIATSNPMSKKDELDLDRLPKHIAIIMDGNGRWAQVRGFLRHKGHESGTKAVREVVEAGAELGVENLTLYAFSTENWNRPTVEVTLLMKLLVSSLKSEIKRLMDNDIKLNAIGNLDALPKSTKKELLKVIEQTKDHKRMTLTLALSYGSREELVKTIQEISDKVKNKLISPRDIDEQTINNHLYTLNLPDVDLLIRTSGEQRISNFLLWQIAYAELYFTDILWPDFTKEDFYEALLNYQKRERRFGRTSEQLNE